MMILVHQYRLSFQQLMLIILQSAHTLLCTRFRTLIQVIKPLRLSKYR